MTCIIATRKFIAADRRVSTGDGRREAPADKVFAGPRMVAAASGTAECVFAVGERVETAGSAADFVDELDEGSDAVVLIDGEIWYVTSLRARKVPQAVFFAGSGGSCAQDFLAGRGGPVNETAAKDALKYVASARVDCGDGVRIVRAS